MSSSSDRPYRAALTRALGATLIAGLVVALIDAWLTARAAPGASFGRLVVLCAGLYAWPALAAGVALGLIGGAGSRTFGPRVVGRALEALRRDRARDVEVTAAVLAALVVALLAVGLVAVLALRLVAGVERKTIGALLCGGVAVACLPGLALLGLPLHRVARGPARLIPPIGPLPGALVTLVLAKLAALLAASAIVVGRLDWRALNLGPLVAVVGFGALGVLGIWLGGGVGRRIGRAGTVVAVAAVLAALLPVAVLRGAPSPVDAAAVASASSGARALVAVGRALRDADGDGVSGFLGGPDCDDTRRDVQPGAAEVPGNGIDDNCLGGDRAIDGADAAAPAATPDPAAGPRIAFDGGLLLIAIDTLRADRLGANGYRRDGRSLTPRIDALVAEGVHFTHARAQAPNTPRSFPSFFSSRYPSRVAVDALHANYPNPTADNTFLFEVLAGAGIATVGEASHFYFDRAPGFVQGFDRFDNAGALDIAGSNHDSAAPRIVPRAITALGELGRGGKRFALFVHLFEPHSTYMEHPGFPITERGTAGLEQKYDYEIAAVDAWVGKLLDAVDAAGLREKTAIVLVSDHGEAFGAHRAWGQRMFFHGQTLYDELLRVPFVVRVPGLAPRAVDTPVTLLDLAPTIVELMGARPPASFLGRSLVPALLGETLPPRPAFAELLPAPSWEHEARAIASADGRWKLIFHDGTYELYDLAADPTEQRDVAGKEPAALAALQAELTRFVEVELARP